MAELHADGEIEVIGTGQHESNGLKKGVVVDIEKTVASIQAALEEAEITSGNKIQQVVTGIAGSHIRSFNSIGMVAIKDKEVTEADVARVIETAKAVAIPTDQQILHVLPQEFIIDGLAVQDLILQPLASANAVLTHDEKELGVALVDIGGGTTDIAVFVGGSIRHSAVIPVAGDQITNDIAMALRTPTADAEEIKLRHGLAKPTLANPGEKIEVPGIGDRGPRSLSKQGLASVIEPRVEELFQMVQQTIRESGYEESLSSGIVLTGGSSLLPGMAELAEDIFLKPVRVGAPAYSGSLSDVVRTPRYATAMGLLEEARQQRLKGRKVAEQSGSFRDTIRRMKEWFFGSF